MRYTFKILILATLSILIICAGYIYYRCRITLPPAVTIDTEGQPTIGYSKAAVHVVVFEELKCPHCAQYNNEIFPILKKEFIDTNKIKYTVIPVSFMPGSMPASVSLLCVYLADKDYPNNDLFFKYLDYIYRNYDSKNSDLGALDEIMKMAQQTSPSINTDKLKKCVNMETYRVQIEKNTEYGAQILGGNISTPSIFVNGILVEQITVDSISAMIKKVLASKGVR